MRNELEKVMPAAAAIVHDRNNNEFEDLVCAQTPRLYRTAYMLCGSTHDAEDLVQMTLIAAHQAQSRFKGEAKHSTWLHSIMLNIFRNQIRKMRRTRIINIAEDNEIIEHTGTQETSADKVGFKEFDSAVMQGLARLPHKQREVMVLRCVENMSYEEIARAIGCSIGTVRSRIHNARRKMYKDLESRGFLDRN